MRLIIFFILIFNIQQAYTTIEISEDQVLKIIDNTCGDTWCEGDFNFKFLELNLDPSNETATLIFNLVDEWSKPIRLLRTSCVITNVRSFSDLTSSHQRNPRLKDHIYDSLSDCIRSREESFR